METLKSYFRWMNSSLEVVHFVACFIDAPDSLTERLHELIPRQVAVQHDLTLALVHGRIHIEDGSSAELCEVHFVHLFQKQMRNKILLLRSQDLRPSDGRSVDGCWRSTC